VTGQANSASQDALIADVWSRTEAKYRRRSILLLTINVCLFAGLGCVAYWLRTGTVFAPLASNYWSQLAATFDPTPNTLHTPTGLSLGPISVEQVPMMIPVLGLILAALVSIPILTAILYRFPCSLPFIAGVGLVAVMPWLAIVLLASCLIASVKPFRSRSRFASALMSLLPVILYFFMASRQSEPAVDVMANPADQIKLLAPLILSIIASAIVMGIVLVVAKVVNYRPGAISPLLAILFLTPAALFEFKVGRDELHYRLLEREFGPASEYFIQQDLRKVFGASVDAEWARRKDSGASREAVRDQIATRWSLALDPDVGKILKSHQERAADAAMRFVRLFPDSVYALNALDLSARALDMRVDLSAFERDIDNAFYDDFPSEQSRGAWEKIAANASSLPTTSVALLRLAQTDARGGRIDEAIKWLSRLERTFGNVEHETSSESRVDLFKRVAPQDSLRIPVARMVFDGRRLRSLLEQNRDPLYGDRPLAALLKIDPKSRGHDKQLRNLLEQYPSCQLSDNIDLELALSVPDPGDRAEALRGFLQKHDTGDAVPEAVYRLGTAYFDARQPVEARRAWEQVVKNHDNSIWRDQAENQLRKLERTVVETG